MKATIKHSLQATAASIIICLLGTNSAYAAVNNAAEDAADACKEAARLLQEDDDLDGAIEEATWCLTGLKQLKDEIKLSLLPDELNGFVGGEVQNQNVMGMSIIEREYSQGAKTLSMTLTGAGGGAGGLGALAELGKLFGSLESAGMSANSKKMRIQKRTVLVSDEAGTAKLNVELKSGGSLSVESDDFNSEELINFMRDFPIEKIDEAMEN